MFSLELLDNSPQNVRLNCIRTRALVATVALAALTQMHEAAENEKALMEAKARAVAEYRLPLPGGVKVKHIPDGKWFNSLSEGKKAEMFGSAICNTEYGPVKCAALRSRLVEFYANPANLLIPYDEATYIVVRQEQDSPPAQVNLEIAAARSTMHDYYALLDKPDVYLTYDSLGALRDDICYNALKRDRIIKALDAPDIPVLTIRRANVQSVAKNPKWTGVVVMTYEQLEGRLLFGVVYVGSRDLKNPKIRDFVEGLKHDDVVQIVGSAYTYENKIIDGRETEVIRFSGGVYPAPKSQ